MLIEHYDLDVFTPACSPGAEHFNAIAHLDADLSDVLPYLNATLRGAMYNPAAHALTWVRAGRRIVLSNAQIAVSHLEDRAEAEEVVRSMIGVINRTWERREEITPDHTAYQRPAPMKVYTLLPKTNCKVCGEPTCFNFALKLIAGQVSLDQCSLLLEPGCVNQRSQLKALLPAIG